MLEYSIVNFFLQQSKNNVKRKTRFYDIVIRILWFKKMKIIMKNTYLTC